MWNWLKKLRGLWKGSEPVAAPPRASKPEPEPELEPPPPEQKKPEVVYYLFDATPSVQSRLRLFYPLVVETPLKAAKEHGGASHAKQ